MYKIYVVEDNKELSELLNKYLVKEGYEAKVFGDGESANMHISDTPDLWILDIMLPGDINGYDLIKKIKDNNSNTPTIFTSARDEAIEKVFGLELGSDDYVAKPYNMRELMLRIKNILNRCYKNDNKIITYDTYKIDAEKRSVYMNDELINLTSKEYELLIFLLKNKGKAFSRDQILYNIWGDNYYGSDRVVDDLMRRLRAKMEKLDVETIYGFGYRLK